MVRTGYKNIGATIIGQDSERTIFFGGFDFFHPLFAYALRHVKHEKDVYVNRHGTTCIIRTKSSGAGCRTCRGTRG
jgi:hypothetical protein